MFKRLLASVLACIVILLFAPALYATEHNTNEITVMVGGQQVDFPDQDPFIINGRTLVPIRGVFEALGFTAEWCGQTQQITVSNIDTVIVLTIGSYSFTTNGVAHSLDVPPLLYNGRAMLPLRHVLESIGLHTHWDGSRRTISIVLKSALEHVVSPYDFWSALNTNFASIVQPVGIYAISFQYGFRLDILAAQQFDHMAIVYFSVRDISGQNRLTRDDFVFFTTYIAPVETTEARENETPFLELSFGMSQSPLLVGFDTATNTGYFRSTFTRIPSNMPLYADGVNLTLPQNINSIDVAMDSTLAIYMAAGSVEQISITSGAFPVGNTIIESMTLTPLGVYIIGTHRYAALDFVFSDEIYLETLYGDILLYFGGGISGGHAVIYGVRTFEVFHRSFLPVDVESVTAIVIRGVRIPITH